MASQPTLSRLENAVDRRACYRLAVALGELYLQERERIAVPTHLLIDLDSTDDPTHDRQEGTAYHGDYRQHMDHPLLLFDGTTNQLITAVLRPGNAHASAGVVPVLKRVVRAMRAVLSPNRRFCSALVKRESKGRLWFVEDLRKQLERGGHKKWRTTRRWSGSSSLLIASIVAAAPNAVKLNQNS